MYENGIVDTFGTKRSWRELQDMSYTAYNELIRPRVGLQQNILRKNYNVQINGIYEYTVCAINETEAKNDAKFHHVERFPSAFMRSLDITVL